MASLFDTNVFLEILLDQEKKEVCKKLLNNEFGSICFLTFRYIPLALFCTDKRN